MPKLLLISDKKNAAAASKRLAEVIGAPASLNRAVIANDAKKPTHVAAGMTVSAEQCAALMDGSFPGDVARLDRVTVAETLKRLDVRFYEPDLPTGDIEPKPDFVTAPGEKPAPVEPAAPSGRSAKAKENK